MLRPGSVCAFRLRCGCRRRQRRLWWLVHILRLSATLYESLRLLHRLRRRLIRRVLLRRHPGGVLGHVHGWRMLLILLRLLRGHELIHLLRLLLLLLLLWRKTLSVRMLLNRGSHHVRGAADGRKRRLSVHLLIRRHPRRMRRRTLRHLHVVRIHIHLMHVVLVL